MSKSKDQIKREIEEDIEQYERTKSVRKSNSFSKEEWEKCKKNIKLTEKQNELFKGIKNNILTVVHGAAGTSKTFTSCYAALDLLANKKVEKIIITKPIQESGESLGYLPGNISEKTQPYQMSFYNTFVKLIGKSNTDFLFSCEDITFEPIAFLRGSSFDNAIMLLDEAQNSSMKQLMLWATRLGKDSKCVAIGDVNQYDVRPRDSGFGDFINMVQGMKFMLNFKFENIDIVRNKFLVELTDRYDKYKADNNYH